MPPPLPGITVSKPRGHDLAFAGCRATVMGLGRHGGGMAAVRFLAAQGAQTTVTDVADAASLAQSLRAIEDLDLARLQLGGHDAADFQDADLVVVNPAVRPGNRWIELARQAGAQITSEIELLLGRAPCPVVGVTGSNGKSTTSAMIAAILSTAGKRVWLGGNIERSLLGDLQQMEPDDRIVLELSSFQLYWLSAHARLPEIAVVTNCTPNHLDWHPDFGHYAAAKRRLLAPPCKSWCGPKEGVAVLNAPLDERWKAACSRRLIVPWDDARIPALTISGRHNRQNGACAAAAALAAGASDDAVAAGLRAFRGLPHRLETIAHLGGRCFINDTQATTPEAVIAALAAVDGHCWLLCGGADKGAAFDLLAEQVALRCAGAACYGTVGPKIHQAIQAHGQAVRTVCLERLDDAVAWCFEQSQPGDTILLSPACASTDQYRDYAHRAADFRAAAERLT